jgi:drug/metabolite transporter (DMT)-like permease
MSRRAWAVFLVLSAVWGMPYLLIKIAVEDVSPATLVFLRSGIAALVLIPYALSRGGLRVPRRHWGALAAFAALEMIGPWLLLSWAQQHVTSSFTGVLIAATPIVAIALGLATGETDRPDRVRVGGMVVALLGVALLLGLEVGVDDAAAVVALLLVVLGYAAAPLVVSRSLGAVPAVRVNTWALALAALVYAPIAAPELGGLPSLPGRTVTAVLLLGTLSTALALMLFFWLIRRAGPHRTLVVTFVNPVVAVALGALVADEALTPGTAIGLPLILLGCVLATRRGPGTSAAAPVPEPHGTVRSEAVPGEAVPHETDPEPAVPG